MTKHNKLRNSAFLYECLIFECAKASAENDLEKGKKAVALIKEFFAPGKELVKELVLFRELLETKNLDEKSAEKLLTEVKRRRDRLNNKQIFDEQTRLIGKIKKMLGDQAFGNFIPSYRSMASIAQIFSEKTPAKSKVLLEKKVLESVTAEPLKEQKMEPIDNIVYRSFVKRFNESYGKVLNEEQAKLISSYVMALQENQVELNLYLDKEIGRLKEVVTSSTKKVENKEIREKLNRLLEKLEGYKKERPNDKMIAEVLKIQNLARELRD